MIYPAVLASIFCLVVVSLLTLPRPRRNGVRSWSCPSRRSRGTRRHGVAESLHGPPRAGHGPAAARARLRRRRRRRARGRGHGLLGDGAPGRGGDAQGGRQQGARPARVRGQAHRAHLHVGLLAGRARRRWCDDTVAMARVTGEDAAAGLPDEMAPAEDVELGMFDPSPGDAPDRGAHRVGAARRRRRRSPSRPRSTTRRAARSAPATTRSCSPTATRLRRLATARRPCRSRWCRSPQRDGQMQRDYWYTRAAAWPTCMTPEEVGRIAGERTLRRLGSRQVPTCEVPVVFDPETAAELLGHLFRARLRLLRVPQRDLPQGPPGRDGRFAAADAGGRGPPAARAGLATVRRRRAAHAAQRAARDAACCARSSATRTRRARSAARRPASPAAAWRAAPSVGASNLYFEAGVTPPEQIVGEVDRGLLRHGPHRLRRGPRVGRLLAGRRRPLDREGPAASTPSTRSRSRAT